MDEVAVELPGEMEPLAGQVEAQRGRGRGCQGVRGRGGRDDGSHCTWTKKLKRRRNPATRFPYMKATNIALATNTVERIATADVCQSFPRKLSPSYLVDIR